MLDLLFFLIYINDFSNELKFIVKTFTDGTIVKDKNEMANIINNDLFQISKWACNWKMLLNPGPNKPTQGVLFS